MQQIHSNLVTRYKRPPWSFSDVFFSSRADQTVPHKHDRSVPAAATALTDAAWLRRACSDVFFFLPPSDKSIRPSSPLLCCFSSQRNVLPTEYKASASFTAVKLCMLAKDIMNMLFVCLADERDRVQKKTFTKWVNKHLITVRASSSLSLCCTYTEAPTCTTVLWPPREVNL